MEQGEEVYTSVEDHKRVLCLQEKGRNRAGDRFVSVLKWKRLETFSGMNSEF